MLRPPPTPIATIDRSRRSCPLPLTAVPIIAARHRQLSSAVAVDCRHRRPQPSTVAAVDRPRRCRLPSLTAAAFTNLPCLPLGEQILLTWLQEPVRSWDFRGSERQYRSPYDPFINGMCAPSHTVRPAIGHGQWLLVSIN